MKYEVLFSFERTFEAESRKEAAVKAREFLDYMAESNDGSELFANDVEIVEIEEA
jgi:hypothetical protein